MQYLIVSSIVVLVLTLSHTSLAATMVGQSSPLKPTTLRCDYAVTPLGIDDTHPGLSWILESMRTDRGQRQTAYQVLVASSMSNLNHGRGDVWDSGKVDSDQSVGVNFAGRPLSSHERCWWKVRAWDRDGQPTGWSASSFWTMGVLVPREWQARWIGSARVGADWTDFTLQTSFTLRKQAASVYFRAHGPENAYLWQISTAGPEPVLRSHVRIDGGYRVLKSVSIANVINGADFAKPHKLTIHAIGCQIITLLDGHLIDTTVDTTFRSGSIGFRESPTETAVFHDLQVLAPDGAVLFQDTFSPGARSLFHGGIPGVDGLTLTDEDAMLSGSLRTPLLRRQFELNKPIRRAWVYASALGIYRLRLNGKAADDRLYAPGWTDYRRLIQYQTYEVTGLLRQGLNALAVQIAPGWYCGNIGWSGPNQYGDAPAFFAELQVQYEDGSTQVIPTDNLWKLSLGPVVEADNLNGESYDARLEQPGWDTPGFHDETWQKADVLSAPQGAVFRAQVDPPVRITQEIKPRSMSEPLPGTFIYDLGQNITGVAQVRVRGLAGTRFRIRQAEVLNQDGTLNIITLHSPGIDAQAAATDYYTFKANGNAVFQPQFTWHGFRYVELTGLAKRPSLNAVTGLVMGTDVPHIGQLNTSNDMLNRLQSSLQWSGRDAFMSIPMDCPQRSERLGWTGDANFYVTTAAFNFDMARFYRKWERDLATDQGLKGLFPNVAPIWGPLGDGGYGGGWGDAGVCVPYVMWQTYGDTGIIQEHYTAMCRFVQRLKEESTGSIAPASVAPAGDWQNQNDDTPQDLVATAYFAYDTMLLSQMADAIGERADASRFRTLFEDIKKAFMARWVGPDGAVGSGSQTSYVLALHIGLLPPNLIHTVGARLIDNLAKHHNHLTTGFVGTQWLLPVLTQIGRSDLAYIVLEQTDKPGWGYMVNSGSTTIWENWGVMNSDGTVNGGANSLNHCALGSCGDWMYQNIGGITPDPLKPGYQHFLVHPLPGGGLTHASATYHSVHGLIKTDWRTGEKQFFLNIEVPVNTTASVYVPVAQGQFVTEDDQPIGKALGVRFERTEEGCAVFTVGSGQYRFRTTTRSSEP